MPERKIKVVQIIASSDRSGGPFHVLDLLRHLGKEKFEPYLISPEGFITTEAKKIARIEVIPLEMRSKFDFYSAWKINQKIQQIRAEGDPFAPMIVHVHGTRAGFLARIIWPRGSHVIYTEHSWGQGYHLKNRINELLQQKVLKSLNAKTDLIIAVSNSVAKFLVESGIPPSKIRVIPNGITFRREPRKIKTVNRAPVIGNLANLNRQKGQTYLIEAMPEILKRYPLASLEFLGSGSELDNLKALVHKLKLRRHVSFLGTKDNFPDYVKHWDVMVMPSIAETFGIAILEAMKDGVPVIASRVGGIPDIITNKKNGLLVKPKDPQAIATAVSEILDHPVLAAKLKRAGIERAKDFDWEKVIKQIEAEYEEMATL